ncbi:diguanylate cyclase domain-containing protein [Trichlorobacter ammonificans]|uniref:Response receiver sensor diguanylate cyclase, PAS domain-containing n=1 Tax=Trichlorobacter ammonificans TaxID=2916410 RepID=A0ABM9D9U8_9BACT|nr:diguanylate cyclase [Trichlorobacter ammonificans]CAH2031366.1 putative Response receiver sensor diguanylate cyclase, PAS domain-containing [Trichlorobacter ammonificans]
MTTYSRILLAEDEKISADYLKQALVQMGYDIAGVVQTGEAAIQVALEEKPDLILMDISLGGKIDGITAAATIRSQTDMPIIYLTANTSDSVFDQAKCTDPYAYLVKPYELYQLKHAIELALFKHRFEKKLKESEIKYRTIFEASDNAMLVIAPDGTIVMVNEEFEHMTGCPKTDVEHRKHWSEYFSEGERNTIEEYLQQALTETGNIHRHFEAVLTDRSGNSRIVYVNIRKFPGTTTCIISMSDISELKAAEHVITSLNNELNDTIKELKHEIVRRERVERQLRHRASHDPLTGLPNRVLLFDRLKQGLAFEARNNKLLAVMILDLDNFKSINDTMGHLSGDLLLKNVAQELQKCMRQYDTVGRIGGDEFVVVVNDVNSIQDIITFAEKIKAVFQKPFNIVGQQTYITTSIGVAVYPLHGSTIETLLKKADMAMYAAKRDGRNTFRFFYDALDAKTDEQAVVKTGRRATHGMDQFFRLFVTDKANATLKEH